MLHCLYQVSDFRVKVISYNRWTCFQFQCSAIMKCNDIHGKKYSQDQGNCQMWSSTVWLWCCTSQSKSYQLMPSSEIVIDHQGANRFGRHNLLLQQLRSAVLLDPTGSNPSQSGWLHSKVPSGALRLYSEALQCCWNCEKESKNIQHIVQLSSEC